MEKPQNNRNKEENKLVENFVLQDGRVYRTTKNGLVWLVPSSMKHNVVRIAHHESGHCSVQKTMEKLQDAYWFPNMRTYVEKYIQNCIACLYNKKKGGKPEGYLHPIPKGKVPLEVLHLDHMGPFPRSMREICIFW